MTIAVKICGVTTEDAVETCGALHVDWIGFVFFPKSPRHLEIARARALAAMVPRGVVTVGLFVAPSDDDLARVLDAVPLGALQIYDSEERIAALKAATRREIWRGMPIAGAAALPRRSAADRLVIEGLAPQGSTRPGGMGSRLDWSGLAGWNAPVPWLLAGGLTPGNVATAIRDSGAIAVDVSSGVELRPGVKDPDAIRAFVHAARTPGTAKSARTAQ